MDSIYANWVSTYLFENPRAADFRYRCKEAGLLGLDNFLDQLQLYEPFVSDFSKFRWNYTADQSFLKVPVIGQIEWWQNNPKLQNVLNHLHASTSSPSSHTIISMDQITDGVNGLSIQQQKPSAGFAKPQTQQQEKELKLALLRNAVMGTIDICAEYMMDAYVKDRKLDLAETCAAYDKLTLLFRQGVEENNIEKQKAVLAALTEFLFKLEPYTNTKQKQLYFRETKRNIEKFSNMI